MKHRRPAVVAPARPKARRSGPAQWLRANWLLFLPLVLLVVFFWDILLGRRFYFEDAVQMTYPSMAFLAHSLQHFRIPFWTPYVFGGTPFLNDLNSQVFYPTGWLVALFANPAGRPAFLLVELPAMLHLLAGAWFMYALLRAWKLTREAALFGGVSFMLCGFMTVRTIHLSVVATLAFLPLLLLLLHRALAERKIVYALAGGLVYGLTMLAGFPQFLVYLTYALGLYCLFCVVGNWREQGAEGIVRAVASMAIIIAVGAGVAAVQYLPAMKYVPYTVRNTITWADQVDASVSPAQLFTLLVPKFFGSVSGTPPDMTDTVPFWAGGMNYTYWETILYVGILPLLLAVFALGDRKQPRRWFLFTLAAIGLVLALGKYTPLYRLALAVLPGLKQFRIPGRFGGLVAFALPALGACGMDFLLRADAGPAVRRLVKWAAVAAGAAAVVWVLFATGALRNIARPLSDPAVYSSAVRQYGLFMVLLLASLGIVLVRSARPGARALVFGAAVVLTFLDLSAFGRNFNRSPVNPDEYPYVSRSAIQPLLDEGRSEPFRVNTRRDNTMLLGRNQGNLDRIELLEGYTPLRLSRFVNFITIPAGRQHDLLNVKYRVNAAGRGLEPNPTYLARARMVYRYRVVASDSEALRTMRADSFDYRNVAIVESAPDFAAPASESVGNSVRITGRGEDRMSLDVATDSAGMLVLAEIYYPEWKARVDGRPAAIFPVDYALRGITIPAGTHRVELYYDGRWLKTGGAVSLLALLAAGLGIVVLRRRGRGVAG